MEKSQLKQKLLRKYRGVPLFVIMIACVSIIGAAAATYFTWGWLDALTYPPYEGVAPGAEFEGSGTIEIQTRPTEPNILNSECTVSGIGYPGETTQLDGTITLMNAAYTLQQGYDVYVLLVLDGGSPTGWFVTENGPELNSGNTEFTFNSQMNLQDVGTYTITIQITGMVWITP